MYKNKCEISSTHLEDVLVIIVTISKSVEALHLFFLLPLSQNKCCIPTAQISMVVDALAQLGDKTDHL